MDDLKLQTYSLPKQLVQTTGYYETTDKKICVKINEHKQSLIKGNASLTENLFSFVLSGHKEILYSSGKYELHPENGCFLRKGNFVVSERFDDDTSYKGLLIFLSDKVIDEIFQSLQLSNIPENVQQKNNENHIYVDLPLLSVINNIIEVLKTYGDKTEILDKILPLKIKELIVLLLVNNKSILRIFHQIAYNSKSLTNLFELHYKDNLSLANYAHLSCLSISTLKRKFKQETNQTPYEWIANRRLEESKNLLVKKELNISDIAFQLGYDSLSHFSRSFSDKYKISPSQFRNELFSKVNEL